MKKSKTYTAYEVEKIKDKWYEKGYQTAIKQLNLCSTQKHV